MSITSSSSSTVNAVLVVSYIYIYIYISRDVAKIENLWDVIVRTIHVLKLILILLMLPLLTLRLFFFFQYFDVDTKNVYDRILYALWPLGVSTSIMYTHTCIDILIYRCVDIYMDMYLHIWGKY